MNVERMRKSLDEINKYGESNQGINRLAYSKIELEAIEYLVDLFKKENMHVRKDAVGNIIARREGSDPSLPAVACGSHIDTVYNAGRFDGTVGVIAGIEVIRFLNEKNIKTSHPIEIIVFACEESARFGVATIGSKAMTGMIKKDELATLKDKDGISIADALKACSLNIEEIEDTVRDTSELKVFYELHIEQGPVLETEKKDIGIVTGIAAPTRFNLEIIGKASHSGTTPMDLRRDALSGAAEIVLELEDIANQHSPYSTVATVGFCEVTPGAMNIIPGKTEIKVDIRSISDTSKQKVVEHFYNTIEKVKKERNLKMNITKLCDEEPIELNKEVIQSLIESCERHGFKYKEMVSGAGHDAMNMAKRYPTGMIFVPSKDGLSHHPDEYTPFEQIYIGTILLKEEILKAAQVINWGERVESI